MTELQVLQLIVGPAVTAAIVTVLADYIKRRRPSRADEQMKLLESKCDQALAGLQQKHQIELEAFKASIAGDLATINSENEIRVHRAQQEIRDEAASATMRAQAIQNLCSNLGVAYDAARRLAAPSANESDDVLLRNTAAVLPRVAAFIEFASDLGSALHLEEDELRLCAEFRTSLLTLFLSLDFDAAKSSDQIDYLLKLQKCCEELKGRHDQLVGLVQSRARRRLRPNDALEPTAPIVLA